MKGKDIDLKSLPNDLQFNWRKILQPNTVVNPGDHLLDICRDAQKLNLTYSDGSDFETTAIGSYINFYESMFGRKAFYTKEGYTILEYDDIVHYLFVSCISSSPSGDKEEEEKLYVKLHKTIYSNVD